MQIIRTPNLRSKSNNMNQVITHKNPNFKNLPQAKLASRKCDWGAGTQHTIKDDSKPSKIIGKEFIALFLRFFFLKENCRINGFTSRNMLSVIQLKSIIC
ncbi:hypothetical protein CIPAW_16G093900 [Carya illinoinensis]|uniref:Uncharacterized protein n=1 Tax=Carya illinoinensis TaxID=32201 RepID=A0A8T1N5T6_CARIL|nr:hypothetical protein CIPAW_16G093900 [Carya illinoinensis]